MATSLRSNDHGISGSSAPLPNHVLPTKLQVLKSLQLSKENLIADGKKQPSVNDIIKPVLSDLFLVWNRASIPTITYKGVEWDLKKLWESMRDANKNASKRKRWESEQDLLFDICSCKCPQILCEDFNCLQDFCDVPHIRCQCEAEQRVPIMELAFLFDQRGARKMVIGGVDKNVTEKLMRSQKRKRAFEAQVEKEEKRRKDESEKQREANTEFFSEPEPEANTEFFSEPEPEGAEEEDKKKDPDWDEGCPSTSTDMPKTRNYHPLPKTCQALDRRGVSSEAGADIVNSFAEDMGLLTQENKMTMTVDRTKLARGRKAGRIKAQKQQIAEIGSKPVTSFYFDGKKDLTLTRVLKNGRPYQRSVIEDHYAMLEEPGSIFLGHQVPFSGHGISLGLQFHRFLKAMGWDGSLMVAGADGCKVNTGHKEGALVYLEKLLGRPLHWFICMLHMCELPWRAIVRELDGGTSGPSSLKGPIGSTFAEEDLSELEVVGFSKIPNPDFPVVAEEDGYELSKDQDFLLRISLAIISGDMPPGLADEETGNLVWSRWVTLANAYFRKYVSTLRPSRKFRELTHAGVTFYAPSWFQIKTHPKCTDGPKNLTAMIKYSRKLSKKLQELVQEVLQRNAYFAHPEAILLAMLADDDADTRARAVNQILTIRMKAQDLGDQSNEEDVDDGRGVDALDENEEDEDDGDCLQLEPSEIAAIS